MPNHEDLATPSRPDPAGRQIAAGQIRQAVLPNMPINAPMSRPLLSNAWLPVGRYHDAPYAVLLAKPDPKGEDSLGGPAGQDAIRPAATWPRILSERLIGNLRHVPTAEPGTSRPQNTEVTVDVYLIEVVVP